MLNRLRIPAAIALATTAALTVSACSPGTGHSTITSGTVIDKEVDKERCTRSEARRQGKTRRTCTRDEYELDLRDRTGRTGEVKVDRGTFNRTRVGQTYTKGGRR
ncbi:hypothetical protein O4215_20615 [Rhodococcus maanshanensis]|uniref:hypothetical protein n=1 Tax=Rhodococcus maanshanensis TaxID=183556 RepID=UPI0022B3701F|nr:hypothetical protein [Rhodococcus maanshanensis]MCZ4557968.1 hypothetical protein [Rhodococcus maanshanensis]